MWRTRCEHCKTPFEPRFLTARDAVYVRNAERSSRLRWTLGIAAVLWIFVGAGPALTGVVADYSNPADARAGLELAAVYAVVAVGLVAAFAVALWRNRAERS
jgi:hypothetical protein